MKKFLPLALGSTTCAPWRAETPTRDTARIARQVRDWGPEGFVTAAAGPLSTQVRMPLLCLGLGFSRTLMGRGGGVAHLPGAGHGHDARQWSGPSA
jgi:hypothetical protein